MLLGLNASLIAQNGDSLRIVDSFQTNYNIAQLSVDNAANFYIITSANELIKQSISGTLIGNFREKVLGRIGYVDCSNPLLLSVFYPEAATLVQLDNMLNPTNKTVFQELQFGDALLFCRSFDNNFWIYDERNFKLKKMAFDLQIVAEGEWLANKVKFKIKPTRLEEIGDYVFMLVPDQGILVFNRYGMYKKLLPVKCKSFTVINQTVYALKEKNILLFDLKNPLLEKEIYIQNITPTLITSNNQQLFFVSNKTIYRVEVK